MGQKVSSSPRTVYGAGVGGGPDSPGGSTASGGYLSIGSSNGHHNGARIYASASSSTTGQRNRARSLGSTSTHTNGQAMNIPGGSGASRSPDSDPSSSESSAPNSGSGGGSGSGTSSASGGGGSGGGRSRGRSFPFHAQSLPTHLFAPALLQGIKCPVCSKFVGADNIELHLLACLTKPRIVYNEDVLTLDSGECVICLEDMLQGDTIARLPCLCIYHKSCIDSWFERNRSCPEHPND